ncbi:MAG: phosphonopyruvate decarboxylase [Gammaproteobacteria bacterium]|nr:phosphonopyruvate decarboxylase [Gammaproteobacteria bacterium]
MIEAGSFLAAARSRGFELISGVPCSYLTPFINRVIDDDAVRYVAAANEGDAVAIAAGSELGGVPAIAMFQNSGLGNAVSPLTSLTHVFKLPVLLIVTLRGEPGGPPDEPQHSLMGAITLEILQSMKIPWEYFPDDEDQVEAVLDKALAAMKETQRPFALAMRKGTVKPSPIRTRLQQKDVGAQTCTNKEATHRRRDMLLAIQQASLAPDIVIATTGYTGRELFACEDRENQLYMVGSMGCAPSLGLGLALCRPERNVTVIDGDGAAMMRMGSMTTIGYERPTNLVHILLDNHVHESTGAQSTVSRSIDFCAIAAACGYPAVYRVNDPQELTDLLKRKDPQLKFIHVPILPGIPENLGRPASTPAEVASRLRKFMDRK